MSNSRHLTVSQMNELDRNGFVLMPDVLTRETVRQLQRAFEGSDETSGTQHVDVGEATPHRDTWLGLAEHPVIVECATAYFDGDFIVQPPQGRNPLPGYGLQGLHADWQPRTKSSGRMVLTTIWMLDPFTAANGATRVVPGSHLYTGAVPKDYAAPQANHPAQRQVVGPAGSVLLFNGHLWHAGMQNRSEGPRRAVQMGIHCVSIGSQYHA